MTIRNLAMTSKQLLYLQDILNPAEQDLPEASHMLQVIYRDIVGSFMVKIKNKIFTIYTIYNIFYFFLQNLLTAF